MKTQSFDIITDKLVGLTKREYFAAMAMQGIVSLGGMYSNGDCHAEKMANEAVVMADALIAELNK